MAFAFRLIVLAAVGASMSVSVSAATGTGGAMAVGTPLPIPGSIDRRSPTLDFEQSAHFRAWFTRIVRAQLERGPDPRWTQRDCAGYVRFGVSEALKDHDAKWFRAIGIEPRGLPPEIAVPAETRRRFAEWSSLDGRRSSYASAIGIVQSNARFVGKDVNQARPGDLLFFDQGEDQHLMIWLGTTAAYHTGTPRKNDSGLRTATLAELTNWKDTRWRPLYDNPNFIGIYRLSFLSP